MAEPLTPQGDACFLPMGNWIEHLDSAMRLWAAGLGAPLEAIMRLTLAALCGGLVGLERELRGRQAGFRTHLLVCMGSALVMVVSMNFALTDQWPAHPNFTIRIDPARIAYGVMGGIGFLGAGTIMQSRGVIRGLTTAAALWCVAAIGLTVGFGLYLIAIMATILVMISLFLLSFMERIVPRREYRILTLQRPWSIDCAEITRQRLSDMGWTVSNLNFTRSNGYKDVEIIVRVHAKTRHDIQPLIKKMEDDPSFMLLGMHDG